MVTGTSVRRTGREPAEVFPPGDFIREELEARGWTQGDLAQVLGRPVSAINEIINGKKRLTAETAKAFAAAFGTSAQVWMNLEKTFRLAKAAPPGPAIARRAKKFEAAR